MALFKLLFKIVGRIYMTQNYHLIFKCTVPFTLLCNHTIIHLRNSFPLLRLKLCTQQTTLPHVPPATLPQPLATAILFSVSMNLTTPDTIYGWNHNSIHPFVTGLFHLA